MKYLLPFLCIICFSPLTLSAQLQAELDKCNASKQEALTELDNMRAIIRQKNEEIESLKQRIDYLEIQSRNRGDAVGYSNPSSNMSGQIDPSSNTTPTLSSYDRSYLSNLSNRDRQVAQNIRHYVDSLILIGRDEIAMPLPFFGNNTFQCYVVDLKSNEFVANFFWKDRSGMAYRNIGNLKMQTENSGSYGELLFATNGGMFDQQNQPKGLFIVEGDEKQPLDRNTAGYGNFYLQPNGVFLVQNDNTPRVVKTSAFDVYQSTTRLATQSGPMLVVDGQINPLFDPNSRNKHIRSGVGIINDRYVVFIKTQLPATFYEIAIIFKEAFGCENALFLDGAISKFYSRHPAMTLNEMDGFFGALIGIYRRP